MSFEGIIDFWNKSCKDGINSVASTWVSSSTREIDSATSSLKELHQTETSAHQMQLEEKDKEIRYLKEAMAEERKENANLRAEIVRWKAWYEKGPHPPPQNNSVQVEVPTDDVSNGLPSLEQMEEINEEAAYNATKALEPSCESETESSRSSPEQFLKEGKKRKRTEP